MAKLWARRVTSAALFVCSLFPAAAHAADAPFALANPTSSPSPAPSAEPSAPAIGQTPLVVTSPLPTSEPEVRRALPAPLDPVFPSADFPGPAYLIGVPSDRGVRAYGWLDGGFELSTSKNSNYPLSYNDVPN